MKPWPCNIFVNHSEYRKKENFPVFVMISKSIPTCWLWTCCYPVLANGSIGRFYHDQSSFESIENFEFWVWSKIGSKFNHWTSLSVFSKLKAVIKNVSVVMISWNLYLKLEFPIFVLSICHKNFQFTPKSSPAKEVATFFQDEQNCFRWAASWAVLAWYNNMEKTLQP